MGTAVVRRPTEDAALASPPRRLPASDSVMDLLIVARATGDAFGARHFSAMLDRILGIGGVS